MEGQRALRFHQKYLNLFSEDERRSYGFGTTWGWEIKDRIFIFDWTIPLNVSKWITFSRNVKKYWSQNQHPIFHTCNFKFIWQLSGQLLICNVIQRSQNDDRPFEIGCKWASIHVTTKDSVRNNGLFKKENSLTLSKNDFLICWKFALNRQL